MSESKLQRRIIEDLTKRGIYVLKVSLCNRPGHPDLNCFTNKGTVFFIEVKDEKTGKVEDLQLYRHLELSRRGFVTYIINTWEQYQDEVVW